MSFEDETYYDTHYSAGGGRPCEEIYNCENDTNYLTNNDTLGGNGTWSLPTLLFMSVTSSILGLTILATIIGNVFVIAAVFKEKNLQNVANYLIVSLAVADLMVACLVMPMGALYSITGNNWILGPVLCDVWTSSDVLCCTASILHLVAIAVDRYWAVTDIEYIRSRNRSRINTMILLVWLVAVVVSIAPILGWKDPDYYVRVEVERKCLVSQDVGYQIFATCATFYVPLCVILLLYWKIFQTARQRIRHRPGRPTEKKVAIAEEISSTRVDGGNGSGEVEGTTNTTHGGGGTIVGGGGSSTSASESQAQLAPASPPSSQLQPLTNNNRSKLKHLHVQQQQSPTTDDDYEDDDDDDDEEDDEEDELSPGNEEAGKKSETIESLIDATTTPEELIEHETATSSFVTAATLQELPPPVNNATGSPSNHLRSSPTINVIEPPPNFSDNHNKSVSIAQQGTIALETLSPSTLLSATSCSSPSRLPPSSITTRHHKHQKSSKESIEVKRERKAAKTLAIITGAFVVCWLPFFVMALLMALCTSCWLPDWVASGFLWLGYFNSTLNPIIYNVFSPEFRLAFKRILFGRNYGRRRRK